MDRTFDLIMYIVAAVCFALAAVNVTHARVNLVALGLLAWVSVPLVLAIRTH